MTDLFKNLVRSRSLFARVGLCLAASFPLLICQVALAIESAEVKEQLPGADEVRAWPKTKVDTNFLEALKKSANFSDYKVGCHMFTQKKGSWKDFGGANLFFKQRSLLRAEIKSSDYRDGSVVVKQADGIIRGHGGGMLRAMKMTIEPDSRTIKLPTGYSLTSSDFFSLYDALKLSLLRGATASTTNSGINVKLFKKAVQVLVMNTGSGDDKKITEVVFIDPSTKIPLGWNTYKDGEPNALVLFEGLVPNKGLSDDLFRL